MTNKVSKHHIVRENREYIKLAGKCKLISPDQEKQTLSYLVKQTQNSPEPSVIDVFKELTILSSDDIGFLVSIKKHLEIKFLDKRFAKLAIANNFTNAKIVEKSFHLQTAYFKKNKQSVPLGDIMAENKKISQADKTALLLTQDRIKDEYLAQAFEKIAKTRLEKIDLNKRFGSIAVGEGYVSNKDVEKALELKKKEIKNKLTPRFIGEILEESFGLSHEKTIKILNKQKVYEKKKLNLEKVLYNYTAEIKTNALISKLFEYQVSQDKLEAHIRITKDFFEEISVYNMLGWIRLLGIQFGVTDDADIDRFLNDRVKGSELKIAQGLFPKKGEDAVMEFFFDLPKSKALEENKNREEPVVKKRDLLAIRTPPKKGTVGKTIMGQSIPPPEVNIYPLKCGDGVREINNEFFAEIDGCPMIYNGETVFVIPSSESRKTLMLKGEDVSFETKDRYKDVNLEIIGEICEAAIIKCHSITVDGNVNGRIIATGNIDIKGRVGLLPADNMDGKINPRLMADGDISVSLGVENAEITTGKTFQAINSDIVSSNISAYHRITAKNICSNGFLPCVLEIGKKSNEILDKILAEIDKKEKKRNKLSFEEELKTVEHQLYHQIQVQDEYREKQTALTYLIKIMGNLDFEDVESMRSGFDFIDSTNKETSTDKKNYGIPKKTKSYQYLEKIQDQIDKLKPEDQIGAVEKLLEDNQSMYKTATDATVRMEKEYLIKADFLKEKKDKNKSEIETIQHKLDLLFIEKDRILLKNENAFNVKISEIRIKNRLDKGTVIKGNLSKCVIDQIIYGVKIVEADRNNAKTARIDISGYFE